jgi:hypothetical protein
MTNNFNTNNTNNNNSNYNELSKQFLDYINYELSFSKKLQIKNFYLIFQAMTDLN